MTYMPSQYVYAHWHLRFRDRLRANVEHWHLEWRNPEFFGDEYKTVVAAYYFIQEMELENCG